MAQATFNTANVVTSAVQNSFLVKGDLVFANVSNVGYTQIVGVPVNFTPLTVGTIGKKPHLVDIASANANGVSSFSYCYRPVNSTNANLAVAGIQIFNNGNLASEVATGNLSSVVMNDVIKFQYSISRLP